MKSALPTDDAWQSRGVERGEALGLHDEHGRLVAANPAYEAWLQINGQAVLDEGIRRIVDGVRSLDLPPHAGLAVRIDRLEGGAGALALITVRSTDVTPPPALDALTQLPDRRALADRVDAWRRAASPAAPQFAVLFLDLDGFKAVNDSHGHAVGDAVLQTLADRWVACVRDGDLIARYGGDEFVMLIQNARTVDDVDPVIRRLCDATCRPVAVGNRSLEVSATIGWAAATKAAESLDALIAAADRDMYARKGRVVG